MGNSAAAADLPMPHLQPLFASPPAPRLGGSLALPVALRFGTQESDLDVLFDIRHDRQAVEGEDLPVPVLDTELQQEPP